MTSRAERLLDRADEYLEAARASLEEERFSVGYEEARTAAELGAKAMLSHVGGAFRKEHNVAGDLRQAGLIPPGTSAPELSTLLGDYSRGTYGFDRPIQRVETKRAIEIADRVILFARSRIRA